METVDGPVVDVACSDDEDESSPPSTGREWTLERETRRSESVLRRGVEERMVFRAVVREVMGNMRGKASFCLVLFCSVLLC